MDTAVARSRLTAMLADLDRSLAILRGETPERDDSAADAGAGLTAHDRVEAALESLERHRDGVAAALERIGAGYLRPLRRLCRAHPRGPPGGPPRRRPLHHLPGRARPQALARPAGAGEEVDSQGFVRLLGVQFGADQVGQGAGRLGEDVLDR